MSASIHLRFEDREYIVTTDGSGAIRIDGHVSPIRVDSQRNGLITLTEGDRRIQAYVVTAPDGTWVFMEGRTWRLESTRGSAARRTRARSHDQGLSAPMPATVVKVLVGPGDTVAKGDVVLVLEAMKMELPIRAPSGGRVRAVSCAPGELVQPGVPLLEIE